MGLRFLRNNCNNLGMIMFDYFDGYQYDEEQQRYVCGTIKQVTLENGVLKDVVKKEILFLDDSLDNKKKRKHPINRIFHTMLQWFSGRYQLLEAIQKIQEEEEEDDSDDDGEEGAEERRKRKKKIDVRPTFDIEALKAAAQNLHDHIALLEILDSYLDDPEPGKQAPKWPENDKVGDQLKAAKKQRSGGDEEKPRVKRVKTIQSGKASARASSSARASGSPSPAVSRAPVRTRGSRLTRDSGVLPKIIR